MYKYPNRNKRNIRHPLSQWNWINKTNFQKLFNLCFYGCIFPQGDLVEIIPNRFFLWVSLDIMYYDGYINPSHLFITHGKGIPKFLEKRLVLFNFYCWTILANVNMFNNPWLHQYVDVNSFSNFAQGPFRINIL